jgi:hypothetical protein
MIKETTALNVLAEPWYMIKETTALNVSAEP